MNLSNIEWIFFDLDGTLWDHPAAVRASLVHICKLTGMDHSDCVDEFVHQSRVLWEELANGTLDVATLRVLRFENVLKKFGLYDAHCPHQISDAYMSLYLNHPAVYPDAPAVVRAAAARAKIAILTNAPHETQDTKLAQLEDAHLFKWMLTTDETKCVKTDPPFYRMAAERAGNPQPERILYVGDAWEHDIAPAAPLGWNCVWINLKGVPIPEQLPGVTEVPSIGAVLEMLDESKRDEV